MSTKALEIAEMLDTLPSQEQELAYEMLKRIILAWDSDFTKVTDKEREEIAKAEQSGFVSEKEIDWDNLEQYLND